MVATKDELRNWFNSGVEEGADLMLVVCDSHGLGVRPVYCKSDDFEDVFNKYNGVTMHLVIEVFDLDKDRESQIQSRHMPDIQR